MTLETVKATYDPQARAIYVKLSNKTKKIDKTVPIEQTLIYFDYDKDNEIVGVEVILP